MKLSATEPGVVVSSAVHVALLLATLVAFADTPVMPDAQESVPVDVITDQQFNEITKGDKQARKAAPTPVKADKKSEVEEHKPTPAVEAKVDIPTPPPPLKRIPDPGESDEKREPIPTPPQRVAALPPEPPKPEPQKPEPPKPPVRPTPPKVEAKPEPPKPKEAEAIEPPKPPVKPKIEPKKVEAPTPEPPKKVRPTPPQETARPAEKPSLDKMALAKLLDAKKAEEKPAARPKSGDETSEPKSKFNSDAVSKILSSKEPPGSRPSTAHTPSQVASLGSPTASAAKMSPSMLAQLDGILLDQYKACWSYLNLGNTNGYIPKIKVEYSRDGALIGQPSLSNPSGDPNVRGLADSALRAIRRCNPLKIPAQFAPYFDQWKSRFVRFDPEELSG